MLMEIKLSKHRFLVLGLYCLISLHINSQWTQFQVIADFYRPYFGVSNTDLDWTMTLWCPVYLVGCFISAFCLDKIGLRFCFIMASLLNLVGAATKLYSIIEVDFILACLGQSLVASGQVFIFFLPSSIALTWFPVDVASTITAIALFPMYFGNGLGYYLPSLAISNSSSPDAQKTDLKLYFELYTLTAGAIFILILLLVKNRPEHPPSLASVKASASGIGFFRSWKLILCNRASNIILVTFTFLQTLDNVFLGLLSPMIAKYFPNETTLIGITGVIASISSIVGSLILAWVTDKTRKYQRVTVILSLLNVPTFGLFLYSLKIASRGYTIISITILGALLAATYPIGMDFIVQANYPISESNCITLMMFSNQVVSWLVNVLISNLLQDYSLYYAFTPIGIMLGVALIFGILTKDQLNRDAADTETAKMIE